MHSPDISDFLLSTYDYSLPHELIAQESVHPADEARLLVTERKTWVVLHNTKYRELPDIIPPDRVLFFNDSRVLRSRVSLCWSRALNPTWWERVLQDGEVFFLKMLSQDTFEALVRPWRGMKRGMKFQIHDLLIEVLEFTDDGRIFRILQGSIYDTMQQFGQLPLPPYIDYDSSKEGDYQTIFARSDGSVAAPTASLHFTDSLLSRLSHERVFVTLHVWLGTFKGIKTEDIRDFSIHGEIIEVEKSIFDRIASIKGKWQKVLAVGTTVCRTLESLLFLWVQLSQAERQSYQTETQNYWNILTRDINVSQHRDSYEYSAWKYRFETYIYIYPWYIFRVVDELITNFHLPRSSLLVLVSAFTSVERMKKLYQYAIQESYRFYSFGDGMYIMCSD